MIKLSLFPSILLGHWVLSWGTMSTGTVDRSRKAELKREGPTLHPRVKRGRVIYG